MIAPSVLLLAGFAAASPGALMSARDGSTTLADCLGSKNVPVDFASSPDFSQLAAPYNLRLPYTPAAIVLPTTAQHVSDAVVCAGQANVKVQARGGGHSYASFSSGGKDGSMVINLQGMQSISVDGSGVATVGGGVRLGNLAQDIFDQAQRALSHGTCPGVGIGGHATHGGYGHTSRAWGLSLDHIVALDVVLANGSFVHATAEECPDVYWALRGAADSIGIVVNFYMQTHPAPASVTYFQYSFPNMFADNATFTNAFLHVQDFATNDSVVDSNISFGINLDGTSYTLAGSTFGSIDDFHARVEPELLRSMPVPTTTTVEALDWISYLVKLAGQPSLQEPLTGYDQHDNFFAKSITVPESAGLTADALNAFFTYITGPPAPASWFTIINLYGGPGSLINAKDTSFAAYADRDALWVFQNYGETAANMDYMNGMNAAITGAQSQTEFGAYLNYVDPSLSPADAHRIYYGDEVYARLAEIKNAVDPAQVFWNPQAIGT